MITIHTSDNETITITGNDIEVLPSVPMTGKFAILAGPMLVVAWSACWLGLMFFGTP